MSNWHFPDTAPIHEQAADRGLAKAPVGATARGLRHVGFVVPEYVDDEARYVADPTSPTGYRWDSAVWDYCAWLLALGSLSSENSAHIVRVMDESHRAYTEHASIPTKASAEDLAAFILGLPPAVRVEVFAAFNGDVAADVGAAPDLHRAFCLGIAACCKRVAEKFRYRVAR